LRKALRLLNGRIKGQRSAVNKIGQIKAEKDGLDLVKEILGFVQQRCAALERPKWAGGFVGLTSLQTRMDNICNIVEFPVVRLTPMELFDASSVAPRFTVTFVGERTFNNLPRKFSVTIAGCRENCVHAETQDLALAPAIKPSVGGEVEGFNILVGG
jgi:Nitrite and sulphite reductase 4Fe-4S domain